MYSQEFCTGQDVGGFGANDQHALHAALQVAASTPVGAGGALSALGAGGNLPANPGGGAGGVFGSAADTP